MGENGAACAFSREKAHAATGQGGKQEAIGRDYERMLRDMAGCGVRLLGCLRILPQIFSFSFSLRALATELTG